MNAIDAKVGQKYLSKKGTPVTVVGHKGEKVTLKISGSENEIDVAKNYELKPYRDTEVNKEAKILIRANGGGRGKGGRKPSKESLSATIDPMLTLAHNCVLLPTSRNPKIPPWIAPNFPEISQEMTPHNGARSRVLSTTFAISVERIGVLGTDFSEGLFGGELGRANSYCAGRGTMVIASHGQSRKRRYLIFKHFRGIFSFLPYKLPSTSPA